jgi:glycine/D-amino acid oxidase-like deaminating enzyme
MKIFDWVVVGGGITGATLAYELVRQEFSVLLLEQHPVLQGATRYGYGGIAYWSGSTELTSQLCAEGIAIHRSLSDELGADTQFRELDLVLAIAPTADIQASIQSYAHFAIPPQFVDVQTACELEPLLDPAAIAGALAVKHGHVYLGALVDAYQQAFQRLGGTKITTELTHLCADSKNNNVELICGADVYRGANVAMCVGAWTRSLLKKVGIHVCQYFTQAELIEIPPLDLRLRTVVMAAESRRFELEAEAGKPENDSLWDEPGHEPFPAILDPGAIQFMDGRLRIGQLSRTLTDPNPQVDAIQSEQAMRTAIGQFLPALKEVPGTWHQCLVAFSRDRLPLIGPISDLASIHLFSGFSNPLTIVPSLARRFAKQAIGHPDPLIAQLSPQRFA